MIHRNNPGLPPRAPSSQIASAEIIAEAVARVAIPGETISPAVARAMIGHGTHAWQGVIATADPQGERFALAAQRDGWYVRSHIVWCLSGGTHLYVKGQKGVMPMMLKDMVRLDPTTIQLWTGKKWTNVLGWSEADSREDGIEIELRSGERIGSTGHHQWPVERKGLVTTSDLEVGDVITSCQLPDIETEDPWCDLLPSTEIGRFVGDYLADGCIYKNTISIATHVRKKERIEWITDFAARFGATAPFYKSKENGGTISIASKVLTAIVRTYIAGKDAKTKHLTTAAWQRDDQFLSSLFGAYLDADGHFDEVNNRYRLGFTRNYGLARDLRTMGARLGYRVRIKPSHSVNTTTGIRHESFRGEVRLSWNSGHPSSTDNGEIVKIRKSRARKFWHIGVEDDSGLFALASGVLTHNSKTAAMPESATDRPSSAHETIWLLTKAPRYYYDNHAVRVPTVTGAPRGEHNPEDHATRNLRNVWTINPKPSNWDFCTGCGTLYVGPERNRITKTEDNRICPKCHRDNAWTAHFASWPPKLAERMIRLGSSERGRCRECKTPWKRVVEKTARGWMDREHKDHERLEGGAGQRKGGFDSGGHPIGVDIVTTGWTPSCSCAAGTATEPCVVLDPFLGSGTTGIVAERLGRRWVGCDLSADYCRIAAARVTRDRGEKRGGKVLAPRKPTLFEFADRKGQHMEEE